MGLVTDEGVHVLPKFSMILIFNMGYTYYHSIDKISNMRGSTRTTQSYEEGKKYNLKILR